MISTRILPVYTHTVTCSHKRKNVRVYSSDKKNVDQLIKQNKRIRACIHKRRTNSSWKDNSRRIILEELISFLDLLDDVVDILDADEFEAYDFNCGEVPDDNTPPIIDEV
jgi:hypothetical protein